MPIRFLITNNLLKSDSLDKLINYYTNLLTKYLINNQGIPDFALRNTLDFTRGKITSKYKN